MGTPGRTKPQIPATRRPRAAWAVVALASLAATGCTSLSSYRFGPSPQTQELRVEGQETPFARAQVSSLGIERDADGALAMRFRFRVRNPGDEPIRIRTDAFELVDAALQPFGAGRVAPPGAGADIEVAPGATALFDVAFPFPEGRGPGDLQLDGLSLEWRVRTSKREYTANLYFARLVRVYAYDPWYSIYVGYSFG